VIGFVADLDAAIGNLSSSRDVGLCRRMREKTLPVPPSSFFRGAPHSQRGRGGSQTKFFFPLMGETMFYYLSPGFYPLFFFPSSPLDLVLPIGRKSGQLQRGGNPFSPLFSSPPSPCRTLPIGERGRFDLLSLFSSLFLPRGLKKRIVPQRLFRGFPLFFFSFSCGGPRHQ